MGSRSKGAKVSSVTRKRPANSPRRRTRSAATTPQFWEQTAQDPDERDEEVDFQRITRGEGSRSLPVYYDDYN